MAFSPLRDEQRKEVKAFLIEKGVLSSLPSDFDESLAFFFSSSQGSDAHLVGTGNQKVQQN